MSSCLCFTVGTLVMVSLVSQISAIRSIRSGFRCPTAVFTFADSLCDGGNRDLEANHHTLASNYPYGVGFGRPTGRYADGLILSDFLIQKLHLGDVGIPSLAYNGTEFTSLNFAYAGATVVMVQNQPYSSPHILSTQVDDFIRHRETVVGCHGLDRSLPWYNGAIYIIEIGGDDFNFAMPQGLDYLVNVTTPAVMQGFKDSILRLYENGARDVILFNMPRADCSPNYLESFAAHAVPGSFQYDDIGCISNIANLISDYNANFEKLAAELTRNVSDLTVYYFDWFAANTYVLEHLSEYGFRYAFEACCGGGGKYNCDGEGLCGCAPMMDPNATYSVCDNPNRYVTFDGIHYTSRFYEVMANYIISGTHVTPIVQLESGCRVIT